MKYLLQLTACLCLLALTFEGALACTVPSAPSRSASEEIELLQQTGFLLIEGDGRKYSPTAMIDYDAETVLRSIQNLRQSNSKANKSTLFHLRVAGLGLRDKDEVNCFHRALYAADELRVINDMLIMSRQLQRDRDALPIAKALIRLTDRSTGQQVLTVLHEMGVMIFPQDINGRPHRDAKPALRSRNAAHLPNLIMRALATRLYKEQTVSQAVVFAIASMGYGRS